MISFLDDVDTLRVDEAELRQIDPDIRSFFNVNTPGRSRSGRAHLAWRPGLRARHGRRRSIASGSLFRPLIAFGQRRARACRPVS